MDAHGMTHTPSASTSAEDPDAPTSVSCLSKSAQKKLAKRLAVQAARPAKRAAERARKKERRALSKTHQKPLEPPRHQIRWKGAIALDCAFDSKMTEKDIISLQAQIKYCYSENRKAPVQPTLLCTSLAGQLRQRFDSRCPDYTLWKKESIVFTEAGLETLWAADSALPWRSDRPQNIVYLTADSPHMLQDLEEDKCYVLGALVDHNKYKNICLDRANQLGIAHAALPFALYVEQMQSRRVLTVNQVMEILLKYLDTRDWRAALLQATPQRKFAPHNGDKTAEPDSQTRPSVLEEAEVAALDEAPMHTMYNSDTAV